NFTHVSPTDHEIVFSEAFREPIRDDAGPQVSGRNQTRPNGPKLRPPQNHPEGNRAVTPRRLRDHRGSGEGRPRQDNEDKPLGSRRNTIGYDN
ncbi:MAG: hypothetical protein HWN66_18005, partial [Candidatus Helarchaeota archaeon]|nr:hypothetical protein [Candidatus Helarchaeota archaeon]